MTALNAIAAAGVAEPGSFSIGALIIGLALLVVNGAFTATEISLLASRRGLIEGQAEQGDRRAVWAIRALRDLPTTFAGTQLGVTMSSLGLGYIAEPAIAAGLSGLLGSVDVPEATSGIIAVTVALTLVVFLHMVVGDMAPKNLAITHAESVALRLAFPFGVWVIATRPLTKLLDVASRAVLWLLRVEPVAEHKLVHTPEELALVLTESHVRGMIAGQDARMMGAALRLSSIDAEAAMTSRVDIAAVPDSASVTALLDLAAASGHTRIPVYHEDLDHITGVVHIKDALILDANPDQVTVAELLRPIAAVPETRDLEHLLRDMLDGRQHVVL
ncbi:MAG: hemolysin family protein, partial [Nitriliruptoraceae bacterium]